MTQSNLARSPVLDDLAVERFNCDAYVIVPGLLDDEEARLLLATAKEDRRLSAHAMGLPDDQGGLSKITLWNEPGDDI